MKKNILLAALVLSSVGAFAQQRLFTTAKVTEAMVYNRGVVLTHAGAVALPKGTSKVVIKNVANSLSEETIRVMVPKDVVVLSAQFTNRYVSEYGGDKEAPALRRVRDSITLLSEQLEKLSNQRESERQAITLLDKNQQIGGNTGVSQEQLAKVVDYYTNKRTALLNSINAIDKRQKQLRERKKQLESRLTNEEDKGDRTSQGKVILMFSSPIAQRVDFKMSYLSKAASWTPFYELRATKVSAPLQLLYKADVTQQTGIDWRGVKLTLTSGNPNKSNSFPVLNTWFLGYADNDVYVMENRAPMGSYRARVAVEADMAIKESKVMDLSESSVEDYTELSEGALNVQFDISLPYDILGNGKPHSVSLQEASLPATYKYYAAPRVDGQVYLVASVKDYAQYNLLPGNANVVFENTYVGRTYIDPQQTGEEIHLTLGADKKVSVKREVVQDKSQSKFLSGYKEQTFTYDLKVRNNKKEPITLVLKDQYPVSTEKDITVELLESSKATIDPETHILTWEVTLAAGASKTYRLSYKLKYPKDKNIQ